MNKRIKAIIITVIFSVVLFGGSLLCILKPADKYSLSERRELASFPEISIEKIKDGVFASEFEEYAKDRFPLREPLRKVKALISNYILLNKDNNGIFKAEGHLSRLDEVKNETMMNHAAEKFEFIYDNYLKNNKVYFSIVPDKNFYIAKKNGYPSLDYEDFISEMKKKTSYMSYIDVTDLLTEEDYYKTDTHWKQENITDVAERLAESMGVYIDSSYNINRLEKDFYGVYAGQYPLSFPADEIKYLTNDITDSCIVSYYDTGKAVSGDMYNMKKAEGKDPYEMFLSGSTPLAVIESPLAKTDKELIIFRDSFGGSLAPLLTEGYRKITLIDIRYVQSAFLKNLVDFSDSDVLFIYSTALLNNSLAMK